jgi:hypothetical protein
MHKEEQIKDLDRKLSRGRTSDGTPSWWRGDAEAAFSGLAVARALGLNVALPVGT